MNSLERRSIQLLLMVLFVFSTSFHLRADIPWPEVVQRLAYENEKLARRPQGHNGEYFVVCTLYYTPKESGFTFERGFDATPITKPGLGGRIYPRDFLRSVKRVWSNYDAGEWTPLPLLSRWRFIRFRFAPYRRRRRFGGPLFRGDQVNPGQLTPRGNC
jgi:hypothetical protein